MRSLSSEANPYDCPVKKPLWIVAAVIFLDTLFYSAIAPLLPEYASRFGLSDGSAGLLVGSYAVANLLAALPSSGLVTRVGIKKTLVAGLTLLSGSCLLFGFAENFEILVGARFVQGIGGALAWTAGISWIAAEAGPKRRGEAIGRVVAAAVVGLIVGPAIGALASEIGIEITFAAVAAVGALVAVWSTLVPAPTPVGTKLREILGQGRAPLWFAVWLVTLPAILAGCLEVVIPLELDEFGASALVIGAIFTGSAAVEAVFAPLIGRLSDRRGRLVPLRLGLITTTLLILALAFATSVPTVAIGVTLVFAALQLFWTPGMALVADICDRLGLDQGITGALTNLAWAGGAAIGSLAAGGLAEAAGRPVAYGLLVLLCALSATAFLLGRGWAGDDLVSGG